MFTIALTALGLAAGTAGSLLYKLTATGVKKYVNYRLRKRAAAQERQRLLQAEKDLPDESLEDMEDEGIRPTIPEGEITVDQLTSTIRPRLTMEQSLTHCARIGLALGKQIRREMGFPKYTVANRIVAAQRIEAHRRENLPDLRVAHIDGLFHHALYAVFVPGPGEEDMFKVLHTQAAQGRRKIPDGRDAPVLEGAWSKTQWLLGMKSHVGPDFQ